MELRRIRKLLKLLLNYIFKTFIDCSICTKLVKCNKAICCSICNHWVHAKCIDNFKDSEYKAFHEFFRHRDWYCPKCLATMLPFVELDKKEFLIIYLP